MNNNPFERSAPKDTGTNANQSSESQQLHNRDDLDASSNSHHHTLGPGPTQAAPGNHTHWQTGDVKATFAEADNVEWYELNGQASPTPGLVAMFGPNLPDARDHYMHYGDDDLGGFRLVGTTGGTFFNNISVANLPVHTHAIDHNHASFTTASGGTHDHTTPFRESTTSGGPQNLGATGAGVATTRNISTNTNGPHTHDIDVPAFVGDSGGGSGTGSALIVIPPRVSMRFLVHV